MDMNMENVVINFSPRYMHNGKEVYDLHVEDCTYPDVYAKFELRIPDFEIFDSLNMDTQSEKEIYSYIKDNFMKIEPYEKYLHYAFILEDLTCTSF